MGYKLGYHILVLPNQVLLINGVLTNEVLLYIQSRNVYTCIYVCTYVYACSGLYIQTAPYLQGSNVYSKEPAVLFSVLPGNYGGESPLLCNNG